MNDIGPADAHAEPAGRRLDGWVERHVFGHSLNQTGAVLVATIDPSIRIPLPHDVVWSLRAPRPFSTDWGAAGVLLDWLGRKPDGFGLGTIDGASCWCCSTGAASAHAPTGPLAVARCALLVALARTEAPSCPSSPSS